MHRQLLGNNTIGSLEERKIVTDHIDGNGLNNTRKNIRTCLQKENLRNQSKIRGNNPYKGITKKKDKPNPWVASIQIDGRHISLGSYKTPLEASIAYDIGALKYHGEFAKPNSEMVK
jgi:hypothetical protein